MRSERSLFALLLLSTLLMAAAAEAKPPPKSSVYGTMVPHGTPRPTHARPKICIWTDPHPNVVFPATGLCAVPHSAVPGSACACYMDFGSRTGVVQ